MLLGILGFIFSVAGIVGYFYNLPAVLAIAVIYIIAEAVIGIYTGELKSIATYIVAAVIGFFVARFAKINILATVAVSLCFEELILGVFSAVFLFVVAILKNARSK